MSYDAKQFSLLDVLLIISKRIKLMIYIPLVVTIGALIYVFVTPKIYLGKSTILPAPSATPGISLSKLAGFDLSGLGMGGQLTNLFRYQTIIESRRVADSVISKYNLMTLYKSRYYEDCVKEYHENMTTDIDEEVGFLTVYFKYPDSPEMAAEITNYIVRLMIDINKELSVSLALSQKNFIEKRYFEALDKIQLLEDSLKHFQVNHDIVLIEEQSKLTLMAMSELQVKIVENEVQYNLLKNELGENHPKTIAQRAIIHELKKQFEKINSGFSADKFYIPKKNINDLAFQYLRLKKDLEINYKIQEFLIPQYELAKIAVIKDVPDVQVLDYASPPDKKVYPKRIIIVIVVMLLSVAFTVLLIIFLEYTRGLKTDETNSVKISEIKANIKRVLKSRS